MAEPESYAQWALEPYCIGMKLRALRMQKGITLAKLATEIGLSTALLSKLETERMIPTLPTLVTICRVYGVSLGYFFADAKRHAVSITRRSHMLGETRGIEPVKRIPLNALAENPRLAVEVLEFPAAGSTASRDGRVLSDGMVYVLEGQLSLESGGVNEILDEGDCAYIESDLAIGWSAAGENRCRVLAVRAWDRDQDLASE